MNKMIPVTPFAAEYEATTVNDAGTLRREWRNCRVLGVTMLEDEPAYVAEVYHGGLSSLTTLPEVRRMERGSTF